MRHVPIAAFKDRASEYVAAAEAGEEIVITRHGKPAAKLSAVAGDIERETRAREALARIREIGARMRAEGRTATIEELIEWKNEGRR
ncbi:type II toxin-antitoxin system Phd/YefM family antitoxin [Sphingomonas gilva]|uniref:Antitoxin n=1 Tax=Sphingomonas gilva TaxID=2305907 RepID=A0A396RN51_9SPHN|nr:type II toxin-antitoxin system Phd/YefM family antitoxin [Sphingomonas gilva]RHW17759.1 type II toxin-antitoxin system Phd/YefM family antitoxin [Sphingomonas gilva]